MSPVYTPPRGEGSRAGRDALRPSLQRRLESRGARRPTRCGWVARVVMPSPSAGSRQAPPRHLSGRSRPLCQAASAPPRPSRRRGLGSPVVLPGTFWDILRHSTPATRSRVEAGPPTLSAGGCAVTDQRTRPGRDRDRGGCHKMGHMSPLPRHASGGWHPGPRQARTTGRGGAASHLERSVTESKHLSGRCVLSTYGSGSILPGISWRVLRSHAANSSSWWSAAHSTARPRARAGS